MGVGKNERREESRNVYLCLALNDKSLGLFSHGFTSVLFFLLTPPSL